MHATRGLVAAVLLVFGAASVAACSATVDPMASTGKDAVTRPSPGAQSIAWHACHESYQCGTVTVPRDWFASGGPSIELSVIRKRAPAGKAIGSLLVNPGGPGEPGVEFLSNFFSYGKLPLPVLKNFDIVSWDPRGTGDSSGISCLTNEDMLEADPLPYPPTKAARDAVTRKDRAQTEQCLKADGAVIPVVGTRQTTHDLDALRAALGDEKLNYLGFSYGTAIGLQYLQEFPTHVRAMVLDGIDMPGTDPLETGYAQVASFERNLDAFLEDCAADATCAFGDGNPRAALQAFLGRLATGARIPASYAMTDDDGETHNRVGTLGYSEAVSGIIATLYSRDSWPSLRTALAEATGKPADGKQLLSFRDQLEGRQMDGTWNHSVEAHQAIACADQKERATSEFGDPKLALDWAKTLPFFGPIGASGQPGCFGWPAAQHPLSVPTRASLAKAPPVLLVNSLHDPATPYQNAKDALALLPAAQLVTWEGEDHTSVGSNHRCIDDAVSPYLLSLEMPPPGLSCPVE